MDGKEKFKRNNTGFECHLPRKSLVKGERFIRSEKRPCIAFG